ncbi:MAG: Ig-like domain-containing protein, partial [Limisphaerales bacterium]
IQLFRTATADNFYTIGKRVDIASSGLAADINMFITNTLPGTSGNEIAFTMRVTDAGSETTSFSSRVQLSTDGGLTWFYDTASDSDLPSGWRFNGAGRYIMWDIAPDAGPVTYDNFSVVPVPVSAVLISPSSGKMNIGANVPLVIIPSNTAPGSVTVTYFGREAPKPYPGQDFVIPVLPDTQNYAREASSIGNATMQMWYAQTEWIITNRVRQNIPFVATLGDCVQNGDILNGGPNSTEWRNATNAYYRLENPARTLLGDGLPYLVTVGNHDQEPNGDPDGSTDLYNQYFGSSHFADKPYYGGHFSTNNDTWFALFSVSGLDFIVLSFEYGRYGSTVLGWADSVLATNQNRRIIVLTHFAGDDTPDDTTVSPFSAQGQAIYDELKTNPNFFLMLGGHVFNEGGEGRRSDTYNGHTVRTLISDYQGRTNGGNGLMRLMNFSPSNNLVSVKTYSPYTGQYETDANSQFSFGYNMQPNGNGAPGTPWVALATNANVTAGTQNSFVWSALQSNKTYEWYVKITDAAGNTFYSPSRLFTTTTNIAPVATNQTATVIGDQPSVLTFLASDANGDALTFRTNSRPIRGLTYNFDPVSGKITYAPARGYRGLDRITFVANDTLADSAVANLDVTVVAPPDTNGNGLPDAWETRYGIVDPNADDDGDGQSNIAEYFANTDPTNSSSSVKVTSAVAQANGDVALTWSSIGGTRYRIQYCTSTTDGGLTGSFIDIIRPIDSEMDSAPYGMPSTQTFIDPGALLGSNTQARYYRIKVVQ